MLSKKARYAIKALLLLGKTDTALQASEIAELESIPKKYLEGILLGLRNAGFLYSKKGNKGGYSLNLPTEMITMDKVIRLVDGPIARIPCASMFHYHRCDECQEEETCSIRDLFITLRDKDVEILAGTSLADMIKKERTLRALLADVTPGM